MRRKIYLSGEQHTKEYIFADQMALFLDTVLIDSNSDLN